MFRTNFLIKTSPSVCKLPWSGSHQRLSWQFTTLCESLLLSQRLKVRSESWVLCPSSVPLYSIHRRFQSPYFLIQFLSEPLPFHAFQSVYYLPHLLFLLPWGHSQCIYLPLNALDKCCLTGHFSPKKSLRLAGVAKHI